MLCTTIEHGKRIFRRLAKNPWIVIDTETENKPPWKGKRDGLAFDRQHIKVFSVCYRGESYSFPTCHFSPKYPTPEQWWKLLRPLWVSQKIVKVFWNFNYDGNVFGTSIAFARCRKFWDAMIGAWIADPGSPKTLKTRAARYGRFLQETKNVNFNDLEELADYAEQDVVATDEAYQMQMFGEVVRPAYILCLRANGTFEKTKNPMPVLRVKPKHELPRDWDKVWLELIEFPVLRSTMRAERCGFPLDVEGLDSIEKQMLKDQAKLLKYIYKRAGRVVNLDSGADLAFLFQKLHINNPFRTKTGRPSFGKFILAKLVNAHPIVGKMQQQKSIRTLLSFYVGTRTKSGSRTQGLPHFVNPRTGRIHCSIATVGTKTGRCSCSLPNLTQIPSRADVYAIKSVFVAPGVVEHRKALVKGKALLRERAKRRLKEAVEAADELIAELNGLAPYQASRRLRKKV